MEDIVVVSKLKLIGNLKKNVILPNFFKALPFKAYKEEKYVLYDKATSSWRDEWFIHEE